jgi:predicted dienelactone hydrolase
MRPLTSLVALALMLAGAADVRAQDRPEPHTVGMTTRRFVPAEPYDWRGAQTHALVTTIWYPAEAGAPARPQWIGPPDTPLASLGAVAENAVITAAPARFPLILLSHGTGGTAAGLAWLGTALAAQGFVVAAVNHPGNNFTQPYTVQGFLLWWLRARDISAVIDGMLADATFGSRLDPGRIAAAGFSLGGYTMIVLAGGVTDLRRFEAACRDTPDICRPPEEFPDLLQRRLELMARDAPFREALAAASASYRDPRIRAVLVMAPALGFAFTPESLSAIKTPVRLVVGDNDRAVTAAPAQRFAAEIPRAELTILSGGVGHLAFFNTCTATGRRLEPELCADPPGINRDAIHQRTVDMALELFAAHLR